MYKYINFAAYVNLQLNHKIFLTRGQQCIYVYIHIQKLIIQIITMYA